MPPSPNHRERQLGPFVGVAEAWERAYWTYELKAAEAELLDIIATVGDRVEDVTQEVERRRQEG